MTDSREYDRYARNEAVDFIQEKRRARGRYRRTHVPYRGNRTSSFVPIHEISFCSSVYWLYSICFSQTLGRRHQAPAIPHLKGTDIIIIMLILLIITMEIQI